jgi:hypothetical protein
MHCLRNGFIRLKPELANNDFFLKQNGVSEERRCGEYITKRSYPDVAG